MSIQSSQAYIEDNENQVDSLFILCRLHQEIRGRRDQEKMCLLAAQFVQSLSIHSSDSRNSSYKNLVKKGNELLMNVKNGNYFLSMTMVGLLLDSLAHGMRQAESKDGRQYLQ